MRMLLWLFACTDSIKIQDSSDVVESQPHEEVPAAVDTGEASTFIDCDELHRSTESTFLPQGGYVIEERQECTSMWHASSGAVGSMIAVRLDDWQGEGRAEIQLTTLLNEAIVDWTEVSVGQSLYFEPSQSGEFFIHLRPVNPNEPSNEYRISASCISGCDLEYTRYPIVFLHGLAGFDSLLNVLDYWVDTEVLLLSKGFHIEVHAVPAFDTSIVRSEQWMEILTELRERGVGRKFNFIGHSQGGLDARYIASVLDAEGIVESITTISTPHGGSPVAQVLDDAIELSPFNGTVIDAVFDIGTQLFGISGEHFSDQMEQISGDFMTQFNLDVPDIPSVAYYSWAGKTCRYLQFGCQNEQSGETVSSYFLLTHQFIEQREGDNDGMVSVQSARWGEFLGVLPADHMDEVGHRFDLSAQPFDAAEFYLSEARRLASEGH